MNRSSLAWGSVLLLLGLLMLADSAGVRLPSGVRPLEFFWPVLLILLGGWLIFGVMMGSRVHDEQASIDLQGAGQAFLKINHGAGELNIAGGSPAGVFMQGRFSGGLEHISQRNGDRLDVLMNPPDRSIVLFPRFDRHDWDFQLNSEIPLELKLQMGANKSKIDLSTLRVTSLKVETGASKSEVTLPSKGHVRADFSLGAASLSINIPASMEARIRVSQGVSDVNIDPGRFPSTGGYYQSTGYNTADNSADIRIEAGAAEIRIQ